MTAPDWTKLANQQARTRQERSRTQPVRFSVPVPAAPLPMPRRSVDPAQNANKFWQSYQPTNLDPLLSAEMKDTLFFNRINFVLTGVEYRPNAKLGPTWVCKLTINDEPYVAMFSDNAVRQDKYAQLAEFVRTNGPLLVGMESYDTSFGNPGYDLCEPYPDADSESLAPGPEDGDVPF